MSAVVVENADEEWLPSRCPSWCDRSHAAVYAEGASWRDSQQHALNGPGEVLSEINYAGRPCREFGGGWDMHVEERPLGSFGGSWGPAFLHLRVDGPDHKGVTLKLTTGEARVLARQLLAMADRVDL